MLTLYYAPGTISVAVAMALEEATLAHEVTRLDFKSGEQTGEAYLAINPKGRVPTLITPSGVHLTETGALLEYIATLAPNAQLVPHNAEAAAHMRGIMYYLASTAHVAHAHKMRGSRWADRQESFDDMKAKVPQTMAACAAYLEENALQGDYVTGERLSIADPYLHVVCCWLEGDGVPVSDYPRLAAFMERMETRGTVKSVRQKGML